MKTIGTPSKVAESGVGSALETITSPLASTTAVAMSANRGVSARGSANHRRLGGSLISVCPSQMVSTDAPRPKTRSLPQGSTWLFVFVPPRLEIDAGMGRTEDHVIATGSKTAEQAQR